MFGGSIVALVTPMRSNGDIDFTALEKLIEWHIESGTDGLVILGTTGEAATIRSDERNQIVRHVISRVRQRLPVIVGTGTHSTASTIYLTQQAMEQGADAALIVTPYYNRPTQQGLYEHFAAVAKAVPMPQILYNVPSRTGCDLLPDTTLKLSKFVNIVGLKDASGDISRVSQLLSASDEFDLLGGNDDGLQAFIEAGGQGCISVVANIAPKLFRQYCQELLSGNSEYGKKLQVKLRPLMEGLFFESNPIPAKWLLAKMGLIDVGIRLPLTVLAPQYHQPLMHAAKQADVSL